MNKRSYEILHNLQILCFIDYNKIKDHFKFLKEQISDNDNEKNLMNYVERYRINKKIDIFNYSALIKDINKCKNRYINKKGDKESEKLLYSKLKNLNLLYFTNNVCETVHSKISNHLSKGSTTKNKFRDKINYILSSYSFKNKSFKRSDYISRTLLLIIFLLC